MFEKKPRRPLKKSLRPDVQSDSLAKGDSVNLKSCLAEGCGEGANVRSALLTEPAAAERETKKTDLDCRKSEDEDQPVLEFFSNEVC